MRRIGCVRSTHMMIGSCTQHPIFTVRTGQAALKLMRIRCHRSPADEERARESLIEEMADVQVMLGAARELLTPAEVLGMRATIKYKQKRMQMRLEENENAADGSDGNRRERTEDIH